MVVYISQCAWRQVLVSLRHRIDRSTISTTRIVVRSMQVPRSLLCRQARIHGQEELQITRYVPGYLGNTFHSGPIGLSQTRFPVLYGRRGRTSRRCGTVFKLAVHMGMSSMSSTLDPFSHRASHSLPQTRSSDQKEKKQERPRTYYRATAPRHAHAERHF